MGFVTFTLDICLEPNTKIMHPNLNELGIIIRLIAATALAVLSWITGFFAIYLVAILLVVFALTGYCPIQQLIDNRKIVKNDQSKTN